MQLPALPLCSEKVVERSVVVVETVLHRLRGQRRRGEGREEAKGTYSYCYLGELQGLWGIISNT